MVSDHTPAHCRDDAGLGLCAKMADSAVVLKRGTYLIIVVVVAFVAGCPVSRHPIECADDTSCGLAVGGHCLVNPDTGNQFCAYPDADCPNGMRWSDYDVEASISGTCVVQGGPDAGVDAPPDASVDARVPDANTTDANPGGTVLVPAGSYSRGCNAATDTCTSDELPVATITLSAFFIDETEVNQESYQQCVAAGSCIAPSTTTYKPTTTGGHPVAGVTWQQAVDYCTWKGMRLPTEAEWEKAARGTDGRTYPWGNTALTCQLAFYGACPGGTTGAVDVGTHPTGASIYGVQDMAGNVSEWVSDWYSSGYYQIAPATDPQGPASGTNKVIRGGSWNAAESFLRSADRYAVPPTLVDSRQGFRCAKSN